jgi:hypothetical protein
MKTMHHLALSRRLSSAAVALSFLVANASHAGGANENAPGAAATQDSAQTGVEMIVRVNMISGDVKRLQKFYEEAFNFKTEFQGVVGGSDDKLVKRIADQWSLPAGASLYTVLLRAPGGGTTLGLTGVKGQSLQPLVRPHHVPPSGGDHYMILRVKHLPEVLERLKKMQVEFWRPLMQVTGGQEFGVYDPDGTRLIIEEGAA